MSVSDGGPQQIVPFGDGRFQLIEGTRRRLAWAVRAAGDTWVFLDGSVHVVRAAASTARSARGDDQSALAAPMPATVVAVNVAVGHAVSHGDVLITLEAMKMELAIKAPRHGTVRRINCRAGELVQAGVPLIELE